MKVDVNVRNGVTLMANIKFINYLFAFVFTLVPFVRYEHLTFLPLKVKVIDTTDNFHKSANLCHISKVINIIMYVLFYFSHITNSANKSSTHTDRETGQPLAIGEILQILVVMQTDKILRFH